MSSGIYEGKPFNEKQLKGIARWILEESSSPMDELHDLLFDSMYNHPKVFCSIDSNCILDRCPQYHQTQFL